MEITHFNSSLDLASRTQHKDLSQIAANQFIHGLPIINRTKDLSSPFAEIVKVPNRSENGNLAGYRVEIEDAASPHGFRHIGNVSERYLLLSNREVVDLACEVAEGSGLPWSPGRAFWDGARFALVLDFGEEVSQDASVSGDGSDRVGLSLVFRTSYDTSWRFEAALMGRRFVCDNGLISGEYFGRVSFKHTTGSAAEDWRGVVRDGLSARPPGAPGLGDLRPGAPPPARGPDLRQAPARGAGPLPAVRRRPGRQGAPALRRPRRADAVRPAPGRDERAVARPEAVRRLVGAQRHASSPASSATRTIGSGKGWRSTGTTGTRKRGVSMRPFVFASRPFGRRRCDTF